jgi:hypothetical protein
VFLYSFNETNRSLNCVPHCSERAGITLTSLPDPATPQGRLHGTMASLWANFIHTGNPNTGASATAVTATTTTTETPPTWPQYGQTDSNIVFALEDDGGVVSEYNYRQPQCDYWDTLRGHPD